MDALEEAQICEIWNNMGVPEHVFAGQHCHTVLQQVQTDPVNTEHLSEDQRMYSKREAVHMSRCLEISTKGTLPKEPVLFSTWPHLLPKPPSSLPNKAADFGVYSRTSSRFILNPDAAYQDRAEHYDCIQQQLEQTLDPAFWVYYLQGYATHANKNWETGHGVICAERVCRVLTARVIEIDHALRETQKLDVGSMQVPALLRCGEQKVDAYSDDYIPPVWNGGRAPFLCPGECGSGVFAARARTLRVILLRREAASTFGGVYWGST